MTEPLTMHIKGAELEMLQKTTKNLHSSLQGDNSPHTAKFPDISLTIYGTLAHVKWYT